MGLDMYLDVKKYEWLSRHVDSCTDGFYPEELKTLGANIFERDFMSKTVCYQVGYWRKANAIHHWFVENCADGTDDCRPVYASRGDLVQLLDLCKQVIESKTDETSEKLLPTHDGFFFGSTSYDEMYYADIEYTIKLLESVIEFTDNNPEYDIEYCASW